MLILGILGDVGRQAAAVGIDMNDAFSLFNHFNPGQTLAMVPALAALLDAGIARGEGDAGCGGGGAVAGVGPRVTRGSVPAVCPTS